MSDDGMDKTQGPHIHPDIAKAGERGWAEIRAEQAYEAFRAEYPNEIKAFVGGGWDEEPPDDPIARMMWDASWHVMHADQPGGTGFGPVISPCSKTACDLFVAAVRRFDAERA